MKISLFTGPQVLTAILLGAFFSLACELPAKSTKEIVATIQYGSSSRTVKKDKYWSEISGKYDVFDKKTGRQYRPGELIELTSVDLAQMAVDGAGNIYLYQDQSHHVIAWSPKTKKITSITPDLSPEESSSYVALYGEHGGEGFYISSRKPGRCQYFSGNPLTLTATIAVDDYLRANSLPSIRRRLHFQNMVWAEGEPDSSYLFDRADIEDRNDQLMSTQTKEVLVDWKKYLSGDGKGCWTTTRFSSGKKYTYTALNFGGGGGCDSVTQDSSVGFGVLVHNKDSLMRILGKNHFLLWGQTSLTGSDYKLYLIDVDFNKCDMEILAGGNPKCWTFDDENRFYAAQAMEKEVVIERYTFK